jgi:predicted ribosome quality control (RQC) complex YloA/Tae2 family protein
MIEGYYRSLQAGEVYAGLHQRLSTAVKQALKKARGRVKSFEQQLQAADEVAAVQKQADIIVANIYMYVTWLVTSGLHWQFSTTVV